MQIPFNLPDVGLTASQRSAIVEVSMPSVFSVSAPLLHRPFAYLTYPVLLLGLLGLSSYAAYEMAVGKW